MSDELVAVVREVMDEIFNFGNTAVIEQLMDPTFVSHTSGGDLSLSEFRDYVQSWKSAIPDLHYRLEYIHQEGDIVTWNIRVMGTHNAELMGIPASGKAIDVTMLNRLRAVNGRPVEHWIGVELDEITGSLASGSADEPDNE